MRRESQRGYEYCCRSWVDKEVEGEKPVELFFLANCVRWVHLGETPNCRLVFDWDWTEEKASELDSKCMLVSICKCQSPSEWKLDLDFAQRQLKLDPVLHLESLGLGGPCSSRRTTRLSSTAA